MTVLSGHTSPETAYVVADYPYGFRLRCSIRFWIETKPGHGQRVVSQTTDPKRGNVWNKPKASTYAPIKVLYLTAAGTTVYEDHVHNAELTFYADAAKIAEFEAKYGAALTGEYETKMLRILKKMADPKVVENVAL